MSDTADQDESSLDRLSQAFAKAMGMSKKKPEAPIEPAPASKPTNAEESREPDPDDACPISPKSILESILFVGHPENEPIAGATVAKLLRGVDEDEISELVDELNADYDSAKMPYQIVAVTEQVSDDEGDTVVSGYRLQLREELDHLRENFYGRVREAQLSQLAIDVLAVVAYNQPMTHEEIDRMLDNGLNTSNVLNQLVRRNLLQKTKNESDSKRKEFATTDRFLNFFNLADIEDLPQSDDPE